MNPALIEALQDALAATEPLEPAPEPRVPAVLLVILALQLIGLGVWAFCAMSYAGWI